MGRNGRRRKKGLNAIFFSMNETILHILNSFYFPELKFADYESQTKYNKIVSEALSKNLEKLYEINKK